MKIKQFFTIFGVLLAASTQAQTDTGSYVYNKPLFDFDYDKPVFNLNEQQRANKNMHLRFSAVSGYREGVEPIRRGYVNFGTQRDEEQGTVRQKIYNATIVEMLTLGFPRKLVTYKVFLEVKDPSKYRYDPAYGSKQEWLRKNAYCYELMLPIGIMKNAKVMTDDMARHFGVTYQLEKRVVKTLVLVHNGGTDKLKTAGGKTVWQPELGFGNNIPLSFIEDLVLMPFVNETGYTENVDLDLKISSWSDMAALRKALQPYGLDLKEEMREMNLFVIKEK